MVTNAELVFWCVAVILAISFFVSVCFFAPCDLYVSEHELDRLNGNKY